MLICNKLKTAAVVAFMTFAFVPAKAHALCVSPICIFEMILKACPGLPVLDFTSIPAIIPHIPAALQKEALQKARSMLNDLLQKGRVQGLPQEVKLGASPSMDEALMGDGEEFASLEAFPSVDSDDPIEIAKTIEILFLRPGWEKGEDAPLSTYDKALLRYYSEQFKLNNTIEVSGFVAVAKAKLESIMEAATRISKKLGQVQDLNEAQRLAYEAKLMRYQLMILENQLKAAKNQMSFVTDLSGMNIILFKPVLRNE